MITQTVYVYGNRPFVTTKGDSCEGAKLGDIMRFRVLSAANDITLTFVEEMYLGNAKLVFVRLKPGPLLTTIDYKTFIITINPKQDEKDRH